MDIHVFETMGSVAALVGQVLNNHKNIGAYYVWSLANVLLAGVTFYAGFYRMTFMYVVMTLVCVHGVYKWNKTGHSLNPFRQ